MVNIVLLMLAVALGLVAIWLFVVGMWTWALLMILVGAACGLEAFLDW